MEVVSDLAEPPETVKIGLSWARQCSEGQAAGSAWIRGAQLMGYLNA